MNCNVCGTPISDTTDICPNCGANVRAQLENTSNDDDIVEITEDMEAPELVLDDENMHTNAIDISEHKNVSTYAPSTEETPKIDQANVPLKSQDKVDISIPSVKSAVEVNMPVDGSAPNVNPSGAIETKEEVKKFDLSELKIGGKTIKFKSGKKIGMPLVIIIVILVLIVGIYIGKTLFSKNYCSTNNRTTIIETKTKYVSDGKNNITNIGNYTYKIPVDYIYDKGNGGVYIYGSDDTFRIFIRTDFGNFLNMSGAKKSIKESLIASGTNVSNIKELNVQNKDFLIIETIVNNKNRLIAYSNADHDYVFFIEIIDINNNFNYDLLSLASDIVQNASFEEKESKIEKTEINDVSSLIIKTSLEDKATLKK